MNDVTNFSVVISNYMKSIGLSPQGFLIIASIAGFLLILLVWLALRKVKLWYWRTDKQMEVLKSIDDSLKNIAQNEMHINIEQMENGDFSVKKEADVTAGDIEKIETQEAEKGTCFNIGKTGKVYTIEELELQIRE